MLQQNLIISLPTYPKFCWYAHTYISFRPNQKNIWQFLQKKFILILEKVFFILIIGLDNQFFCA